MLKGHSNAPDNVMFRLYYRLPIFCQQLALIVGIVLSGYSFINSLPSVSNPFKQIVVYYNALIIASKIGALRLDGVKNIPYLKKKVCWCAVYMLFFLHHLIEYFDPPLQSELKMKRENSLYLLGVVDSAMLLVLSVATSLYRPYEDQLYRPSTEYTSDLIEYVSFAYVNELIELGRKFQSLKLDQVPNLSDGDSSKVLSGKFNTILQSLTRTSSKGDSLSSSGPASIKLGSNKESLMNRHYLAKELFLLVWKEWIHQAFFQLIDSLSVFIAPLTLHTILIYVKYQGNEQCIEENLVCISITTAVALLFFAPFVRSIGEGGHYLRGRHIAIRIKSALICAIYAKALRVDLTATNESSGRIMNLVGVDVGEIEGFCCYSHYLWSAPLEIIIAVSLLFMLIGSATFAGVAVMILSMIAGYFISRWMEKYQGEILKNKDKRMEIINEVLQSIRIIKYFSWEKNFAKKINHIRGGELKSLALYSVADSLMYIIWHAVPCLVGVVAFITYTQILGKSLPVSVGFSGMVLFNLLQSSLCIFPDMITALVRAKISLLRIQEFLGSADVEGLPRLQNATRDSQLAETAIELRNVTTAWNETSIDNVSSLESENQADLSINSELPPYESLPSQSAHHQSVFDGKGELPLSPHRIVLRSLDLYLPRKSFTVIIGTTGSGKTSLLQGAILGEAMTLSGTRYCGGRISYSTQTSWIQNATLRENILFGEVYEAERYERIVKACALVEDFEQFPAYDLTEIGEKGVNLSGGQSQRVNLARASYSKSDIILMDDPLSAVDSKVAEHIFQHLILNELKDRTRVLVTHNLPLVLPHAEHVVILDQKEQKILYQGNVAKIVKKLEEHFNFDGRSTDCEDELIHGFLWDIYTILSPSSNRSFLLSSSQTVIKDNHVVLSDTDAELHPEDGNSRSIKQLASAPSQLVGEEKKQVGSVPLSVYWYYLSAGGGVLTTVILALSCLGISGSCYMQNYSLGRWMEAMESIDNSSHYSTFALALYLFCVLSVLFAYTFRSFVKIAAAFIASKDLHGRFLTSILLATCSWFEATPTGRIISRFSQDISILDSNLMNHLLEFTDSLIGGIQVVTVICYFMPLLLLPLLPVVIYACWVTYQYLCVSREIKRLESVSKSPVFILFSETLNGLPIIRAFQQEKRFSDLCCDRVDDMNRCELYLWTCNHWLSFRMQFLGALVACVAGIGVIYYTEGSRTGGEQNELSASAAGLALLYSMNFCEKLNDGIRHYADTQMDLNCIERIKEYSEVPNEQYNMPEEEFEAFTKEDVISSSSMMNHSLEAVPCVAPLVELFQVFFSSKERTDILEAKDDGKQTEAFEVQSESSNILSLLKSEKIASSWPSEGNVRFKKVVLQYPSASSPVLNEVSFNIPAGKKVGVCGRSGAGKSSLIIALFRIVEPTAGEIVIDGRDIQTMPLYEVRKNIAIVPQDPTLFKGSLRFNLDPFTEYCDEEILSVLRTVQLYEVMKRLSQSPVSSCTSSDESSSTSQLLPSGGDENILDRVMIAEKGGNLSLGHRQLLCMARAILRKPKILILDECTASIDHETDAIIQNVVRSQLSECTVISIAHRLHTIAYYDAVIVMQQGRMMEYDHPYKLMQESESLFHQMCKVSGAYEELLSIASQQYGEGSPLV